jgi:hypothetical protein
MRHGILRVSFPYLLYSAIPLIPFKLCKMGANVKNVVAVQEKKED